jgi:hypothetical protein
MLTPSRSPVGAARLAGVGKLAMIAVTPRETKR